MTGRVATMPNSADCPVLQPAPHTILVVEDDVLIRLLIAEELRHCGFAVLEAANADEAMIVLASRAPLDLIMTDIQMPGSLDGIDLVKFTRTTRPGVKVIVASGQLPEREPLDMVEGHFAKPYVANEVVALITTLLDADR